MTINIEALLPLLSIIVNVILIGGVFIKLENRLTKLETTLSLISNYFKVTQKEDHDN